MTKSKQTLIAWLRDAHAMERASVDSLDRMADRLARFPAFSVTFPVFRRLNRYPARGRPIQEQT